MDSAIGDLLTMLFVLFLIGVFFFVVVPFLINVNNGVENVQLPSLDDIVYRPHAVDKHGEDAIDAREGVKGCPPWKFRVKVCFPDGERGFSIYFWCDTGGHICPGTITTLGGVEKTSFLRPCQQWRVCP